MAGEIEFTTNYSDLSTDNGFQFEFRCNRCGNGYRTEFDTFELSTATNVLDGASGLLGGFFGQAANVAQRAKSAAWEKASDKAFKKAQEEILPKFVQCPRCSTWMCREQCWNEKKGLCKQCAPDLGVEMAAAQSSKSVEEVWAHAKMAEEDKHLTRGRTGARASLHPVPHVARPRRPTRSSAPSAARTSRRRSTARSAAPSSSRARSSAPDAAPRRAEREYTANQQDRTRLPKEQRYISAIIVSLPLVPPPSTW